MFERIPQDFIDDLVERVDISEVISRRIEIKKKGFIIVLVVALMGQLWVF